METPLNPQPEKTSRSKIYIGAGVGIFLIVLFFWIKPLGHKETESEPEKKEPLLHRDEPTKEQIYQEDYKEKVSELLDSGKKVGEVSRETGIRRDVVRKIKKEKKAE
ncbi:MAG TPA: hypothetical protein VK174_18215 [Chitinophagales bacterium]|nr:hypothetical protein [Chitinophagales bacterium]